MFIMIERPKTLGMSIRVRRLHDLFEHITLVSFAKELRRFWRSLCQPLGSIFLLILLYVLDLWAFLLLLRFQHFVLLILLYLLNLWAFLLLLRFQPFVLLILPYPMYSALI